MTSILTPPRLVPWLVAGLGFLVLALAFSGRATLSLVMPALEQDMVWSRTFVSSAAALSLIVLRSEDGRVGKECRARW